VNTRTAAALLALVAVGWWFSPLSPRGPAAAPALAPGEQPRCELPPRVAPLAEPLQTPVPAGLAPFRLVAATLTPLAGISIDARVLSREDYAGDREALLAPIDLALGWGRMREEAVLERLDIDQSGRWYRYRWSGAPPLPAEEIARSSANMHLIPARPEVAQALDDIEAGQRVRIDGWLVEARAGDGWHWRSSTSREDRGRGACEVVYVCAVQRF
jgi:hypothetical protein